MKRIAVIAHGLSDGGAERVAALLANQLAADGNAVLFVAAYSPVRVYPLRQDVTYTYIDRHFENKALKLLERTVKIWKEIHNFRADIAISFVINEMLFAGLEGAVPVVYSLRNDPQHLVSSGLNKTFCLALYKRAKAIVFQTPGAQDFFPESIRSKGVIIANPLTMNLPQWDEAGHDKTIITACRLTEQKNLPMLIKGFGKFHAAHPDYQLKIYGKGALLEPLQALVKDQGLEDCIFFLGHSEEIHQIMARSAIFTLTSDFEGLSNSMLEALAIGVPSVCTDCPPGGAAMYIEDGVSGMLVPVGDEEELSRRFCRLAEDAALCRRISENARHIRQSLDIDTILQQWKAVLQ